jgi:hypothetical protein
MAGHISIGGIAVVAVYGHPVSLQHESCRYLAVRLPVSL